MGVCFEEDCFKYVYSEMLGEEIKEIDNEKSDAVGEICNQIFGSAKAKFAEKGIKIAPAIPAVVYRPNHRVRYHVRGSCLSIEFHTSHGNFWVEAILKNS